MTHAQAGAHAAGPVVVGTDGCAEGDAGLVWGQALALATGRRLEVVLAFQSGTVPQIPVTAVVPQAVEPGSRTAIRARSDVRAAVDRLPGGTGVLSRAVWGGSATVLRAAALEASVVVVTRKQRSAVSRLLLGSTLAAVLRDPPAPVLVVPQEPRPSGLFTRVQVAVRLGATDDAALAAGARLATQLQVPLVVVHVRPARAPAVEPDRDDEAVDAALLSELTLRTATHQTGGRPDVTLLVLVGSAKHQLLDTCVRGDLLVLGAHRSAHALHWSSGSTAAHLCAHAPCPVLVVP